MQVYVVMGNDFPDAVFSNREAADTYVKAKTNENAARLAAGARKIYWRVYLFTLRDEA